MRTRKYLSSGLLSIFYSVTLGLLPTFIVAESGSNQQRHFLTSKTPLILLSANDPELYSEFHKRPLRKSQDSVTVIQLTPDKPPVTRTVYGTVASSILTAPRMAITGNGRYGIVSDNPMTLAQFQGKEPVPKNPMTRVSVIDLQSPNLEVVDSIDLLGGPSNVGSCSMVVAHPDGERFIVNTDIAVHMFRIGNGSLVKIATTKTSSPITSFDVSPDGDLLLGANNLRDDANNIDLFKITDTAIQY